MTANARSGRDPGLDIPDTMPGWVPDDPEYIFALEDLPTAVRYARDRVEDAIKVPVKTRGAVKHA
jgi:hypothetical protein